MKNKLGKIVKYIITACFVAVSAFSLAACSSGSFSDPKDAVKNQYGNKEFNISFNTSGWDEPLEDIVYTANKMPVLPSPSRVGYVFSGWYMDAAYSTPYVDGILYLYMKDVTLYAKWTKEEFVSSGIYELEVSVSIVEGTLSKGLLTDYAGGFEDFSNCVLYEDVCIENSDGHKYLKIPYDCGFVENMNDLNDFPAIRVTDSVMNSGVFIDETKTIANYADTQKTIFMNIDEWDMEAPVYLDIKTTNWKNTELSSSERAQTITTYTVKIEAERFIGFSKPYADYTQPLEDGWYLAKSYYRSENNNPNMGSGFNPVYSYLRAENGKYTLIKEFTPYLGMLGTSNTLLNPVTANYYNRLTSFSPVQLYYDMDASSLSGEIVSDYYPKTYGGTYYGEYVAEFHADTGKYYSIYDFGSDVKREKMIMGGITGYMEAASSMGATNQILSIDYKHLVKLSDEEVVKDYVPLTENDNDGYSYSETAQYYPGNEADLSERNSVYSAVKEYGIGTHIYNFFFSAADLSVPYTQRRVYSSRITVSPDKETNAASVADSRYSIARFNVNTVVYGYNETLGDNLYADSLTIQSLGSHAMRETLKIKTGKSLNQGEKVSLENIYKEKVNGNGEFSSVKYVAYRVKNGVADYTSRVNLPLSFTYGGEYGNIVVVFESELSGGGKCKTAVYLTDYTEPSIRVTGKTDGLYAVGDVVTFPDVKYTWGAVENNFIENYFANSDGLKGINIVRAVKFSVKNGSYSSLFFECVVTPETSFSITEKQTVLYYELHNEYDERFGYEIEYNSENARRYTVTDDDGEVFAEADITYDKDGKRVPFDKSFSYYNPDYSVTLKQISKKYTFATDGEESELPLVGYTLLTDTISETDVPADSIDALISYFARTMQNCNYFYLKLNYRVGENNFSRKFLYNVTFGGKKSANLLDYDAYFTNKKYVAPCNDVYSADGRILGSAASFNLYAYRGDELMNNIVSQRYSRCEKDEYNVKVTFYNEGRFLLNLSYSLDRLGGDSVFFEFDQVFEVLSDKSNVSITYVTDEDHPFSDGSTEKTVVYNLSEDMPALKQDENFLPTDARLFGWVTDKRLRPALATLCGEDFPNYRSYNTTNLYLYAVWDDGIRITTSINGEKETYDTVYYRSLSTDKDMGTEKGSYCIDLSVFVPKPPLEGSADSYSFIGWTGGFIGTAVRTDKVYIRNAVLTEEDLIITPVYKRYVKVIFTQPENYTNGVYVFNPSYVLEGEKIENPGYYLRVRGSAGYTFKGWLLWLTANPS